MKYLSIAQTAERWGISTRRIQILCGEGRVPGAIRIGSVWGIPENAEKPADARIKSGKTLDFASACWYNVLAKRAQRLWSGIEVVITALTRNRGRYSVAP